MDMQPNLCMASSMVHAPMNIGHPHATMSGVKPDPCPMQGVLNFSISGSEDYDAPIKKARVSRDPMSHRIIEKRRRDRMNNCLADLSQLIPASYLKQGQGRIEKTEIIEMAIKHIQTLQTLSVDKTKGSLTGSGCCKEKFYMGYKECMDEVMRCLVEKQGYNAGDELSISLLKHLKEQSRQFHPDFQSNHEQSPELQHDMSKSANISDSISKMEEEGFAGDCDSIGITAGMMSELLNQESLAACSASKDAHLRTLLNEEKAMESMNNQSEDSFSSCYNNMRGDLAQSLDASPTSAEMMARSDSDSKGAYKFKNDIKLRFSADMSSENDKKSDSQNGSDSASNSSQEDKPAKLQEERTRMLSPSSDTTSTPYPSSEHSSNGNGNSGSCNDDRVQQSSATNIAANISESTGSLANSVPGFALHPDGSYYIPVVIHTVHLMPYLRSESAVGKLGVCHPISIPVSFGGPFIAMQNIHIGATPTGAPFIPKHEPIHSHMRPRKRKDHK